MVTLDVSHKDISPSKEEAPLNILLIVVTLLVSQVDIFPLKEVALLNIKLILVTAEVIQVDIFPLKELPELNEINIYERSTPAVLSVQLLRS